MPLLGRLSRGSKQEGLGLVLLTALALALRLTGLGTESLWTDEAVTLKMAVRPLASILTGQAYDPGNPCLYFALVHGWAQMWGATPETLRAFSAVVGALTVPAVWLLASASGLTRPVRLLAALLVAVSPPLIYLSQESRVFALLSLTTTLTAWAATRMLRRSAGWDWLLFAFLGTALVHLHYYGFFILAVLGLTLLVEAARAGRRRRGESFALPENRGAFGLVFVRLVLAAVVAVAFLPWMPIFRLQLVGGAKRGDETWLKHMAALPLYALVGRTWLLELAPSTVVALLGVVVGGIWGPVVWFIRRERNVRLATAVASPLSGNTDPLPTSPLFVWLGLGLGLPVWVLLLALAGLPMIHSHYLAVVIPCLLLGLAWGLTAGWQQFPRWPVVALVPTALLTVLTGMALVDHYRGNHKTDWRGLSRQIAQRAGDRPVYLYPDFGDDAFGYYRPDQPRVRVLVPFHPWENEVATKQATSWENQGLLARMQGEKQGFWLVVYPGGLGREPGNQVAALRAWGERHFHPLAHLQVHGLEAWLWQPR